MTVHIITDSASDFVPTSDQKVTVIPMTVSFGDEQFLDGVDLHPHEFYARLIESDVIPTTSQLTPHSFAEAFRSVVEAGDKAVAITLSAKLSGTYENACLAAEEFPGQIFVVDSETVAIGEAILIERALELISEGLSAEDVAQQLEREKKDVHLVALLETLEYLRRGGRLSSQAAFVGGLLSIKPVVAVENGEVTILGKARGSKNGGNLLIREIQKTSGIDFSRPVKLGYTGTNDDLLLKYMEDNRPLWEDKTDYLPYACVGATIGTHAGPGVIAVAFFEQR